jgi:hypothetical protein
MLVVGRMALSNFSLLQSIPQPAVPNQQFCGGINMASGLLARVYVPTAAERVGDFSQFGLPLIDPQTKEPFPAGIIPLSRLPDPFALRVSSLSAVSAPTHFVPVSPCRVMDTRNPGGSLGGPAIAAGTSRNFPIPIGGCGIPSAAAAYSLNIAVVPKTHLGFLTVWPAGPQPLVATLNSLDGRIKSNAAIVPAGLNGAISVFATDTTDVILDINGYFVSGSAPTASAFYPLTPCRVADTRSAIGALGGPGLMAQSTRTGRAFRWRPPGIWVRPA